jgi:hypothetical protein
MWAFVQQVKVNNILIVCLFFFCNFNFKDCGWRYNTYTRDCLGSRINLERLAQSIRQLIIDSKVQIIFLIFEKININSFFLENCLSKCSNNALCMSITTTTTTINIESIYSGL